MSARAPSAAYTLRDPAIGPVVTVRGAANLGISFMAVSSRISPTAGTSGPKLEGRPLRPFAGMTRIRFKGFGLKPSQPRLGHPSSTNNVVLADWAVNRGCRNRLAAGVLPQISRAEALGATTV